MNQNQYFSDVSSSYMRLLEQKVFEAQFLVTHKSNWITVEYGKKDVSKVVKAAKSYNVYNVVITENNNVKGSINIEDLDVQGFSIPNWDNYSPYQQLSIDSHTSVSKLLETFYKDSRKVARNESPLYFVNINGRGKSKPLGIMTFWDLNKAPVYILSKIVITIIEQQLLGYAKEAYLNKNGIELELCTPRVKSYLNKNIHSPSDLFTWYFHDFISLYKANGSIEEYNFEPSEKFIAALEGNGTESFRNRSHHSNSLIVRDDEHFKDDIEALFTVVDEGMRWIWNFGNPKVSSQRREPVMNPNAEKLYF